MLNRLAAAIPGTDLVISAEEVFELPKDAILQICAPLSIPAVTRPIGLRCGR